MRLLAQGLTERTKQQVVIENRPGAGGLMSAKAVLEAPPDGYTLGVIGNGQAIAMSLFKARPYNVLTDFTFVSITARFEMLLAVKADLPLKSLQDVVTAARKDPGKLNFGAINPGSTQNLSAHLLKQVGGWMSPSSPTKRRRTSSRRFCGATWTSDLITTLHCNQ